VTFTLPMVEGEHWRVLIDTAERDHEHGLPGGSQWHGICRSLTLLAAERDGKVAAAQHQNAAPPPAPVA
jgi:glycogen operon protein